MSQHQVINYFHKTFSKSEDATEKRRNAKWLDMTKKINKGTPPAYSLLKSRARKGIP